MKWVSEGEVGGGVRNGKRVIKKSKNDLFMLNNIIIPDYYKLQTKLL